MWPETLQPDRGRYDGGCSVEVVAELLGA
ncbi:MAG: hypothetical protein QOE99_1296, partial [Actinomycetota bacterium]|nr:hypothetical protein [Actinomycetota bacterium]